MRHHGIIGLVAIIGASVLLSGCVTAEGYRQHMDIWTGRNEDALKIEWGVPDNISPLTDGSELWVYHRNTESTTGGYWTTQESKRTEEYVDKDGNKQTRTVKHSEPYYEPQVTTRTYCETRFIIGSDHTVKGVSFEGDGCVAEEIKQTPAASDAAPAKGNP